MLQRSIINFVRGCILVATIVIGRAVGFVSAFVGTGLLAVGVGAVVLWWILA